MYQLIIEEEEELLFITKMKLINLGDGKIVCSKNKNLIFNFTWDLPFLFFFFILLFIFVSKQSQ